jgi:hypothetical protein
MTPKGVAWPMPAPQGLFIGPLERVSQSERHMVTGGSSWTVSGV